MISIKVRGASELSAKLAAVPYGSRGAATESAAKVIIGNERTGLQHYPPPRTSYVRTFMLRFGWYAQKCGDGTSIRINNKVPYAPYVQGNGTQAWYHAAHGWKTVAQVLASNAAAINVAIQQAVNRFLKSKGLL